ncbi:MAG: aldehyde dehydrogenase [Lachnospiraceae bacterium]|nr:aldehyde dehydrogenase [Lachnospiraceae bacterium]
MENLLSGVFNSIESAVSASKRAFETYSTFTASEKMEIILGLRLDLAKEAPALAKMEKEETGMGVYEDKLLEISRSISNTRGLEYSCFNQKSFVDEEGLTLEESYPYGVAALLHPITHPVASIINSTILMLSAGNSVIHLSPQRASKVCLYAVEKINAAISRVCGLNNLVICLDENRYEYNKLIKDNPDVDLVVATGSSEMANKALSHKKKVIVAGSANPVVIVDSSADIRKAAKIIAMDISFDNNLLCTSEKCAVVLGDVINDFKRCLEDEHICILSASQAKKLEDAVFDTDYSVRREFIGQDAGTILLKAGLSSCSDSNVSGIAFDAKLANPFVLTEVEAPILPIVEVSEFADALLLAGYIESGCHHTASIFSKDIEHLSAASRLLKTAVFIKNGSTLYGSGLKGNLPVAFTVANVTGEGPVIDPDIFARKRRCILVESFERM